MMWWLMVLVVLMFIGFISLCVRFCWKCWNVCLRLSFLIWVCGCMYLFLVDVVDFVRLWKLGVVEVFW